MLGGHAMYRMPPLRARPAGLLCALGGVQFALCCWVAHLAGDFTPGGDFARRPLGLVIILLASAFLLYLGSLALVWNCPKVACQHPRVLPIILAFSVLFRLPLWWSQPIQEVDIYRYLWDGRVLQAGVNPYRYSPAQVDAALNGKAMTPELATLAEILRRSPPLRDIFARIEHRTVATIYPPLSQGVFTAAALLTPERAAVMTQVRVLKGLLLLFDLLTVVFIMGLLCNVGQPMVRVLAYAWCPLILKEFANTGHLDSIAVCFTTAALWWLTCQRAKEGKGAGNPPLSRPALGAACLAATAWACAILAKLYPLVLAPVLIAYGWRRWRWRLALPGALFLALLVAGYFALPRHSAWPAAPTPEAPAVAPYHSSFSGLGEFLRRWEMNDLLFSIVYENLRPPAPAPPWYVCVPASFRQQAQESLCAVSRSLGLDSARLNLPFLFTQLFMATVLLSICLGLALRPWPQDGRQELLRRGFLCLAWLWFLSATQNPWYWSWALPFVVFASRPWLLVSGLALVYYLRFWLIGHVPDTTLPGRLDGRRFFDEVVVWLEHLPVLLVLSWAALRRQFANAWSPRLDQAGAPQE